MNNIRMIATDMDGTLLTGGGFISKETADTLLLAQEKGVFVALCSGRYPGHANLLLTQAGLELPIIGINGCILWEPDGGAGRVLGEHFMAGESALAAGEMLIEAGLLFHIFGHNCVVSLSDTDQHPSRRQAEAELMGKYNISFGNGLEAARAALRRGVHKLFVYGFHSQEERAEMRERLQKLAGLFVTSSWSTNLELMPAGIDKASGCAEMAALRGITLAEVMAFGDFDNDIPMLSRAGLGVAMGNAQEEVKRCARYVTDTNDRDGIAKAVRKFVL